MRWRAVLLRHHGKLALLPASPGCLTWLIRSCMLHSSRDHPQHRYRFSWDCGVGSGQVRSGALDRGWVGWVGMGFGDRKDLPALHFWQVVRARARATVEGCNSRCNISIPMPALASSLAQAVLYRTKAVQDIMQCRTVRPAQSRTLPARLERCSLLPPYLPIAGGRNMHKRTTRPWETSDQNGIQIQRRQAWKGCDGVDEGWRCTVGPLPSSTVQPHLRRRAKFGGRSEYWHGSSSHAITKPRGERDTTVLL